MDEIKVKYNLFLLSTVDKKFENMVCILNSYINFSIDVFIFEERIDNEVS